MQTVPDTSVLKHHPNPLDWLTTKAEGLLSVSASHAANLDQMSPMTNGMFSASSTQNSSVIESPNNQLKVRLNQSQVTKKVVKQPGSQSIKKEKLWHCFEIENETTGRKKKQFMCTICERQFNRLSNVKHHLRSHLDLRQYKCDLCNSTFVQKGNRDRHVARQSCQNERNRVTRTT